MNVIVDVRGMNVNMRVSEDPIEGIFCLAPKAQHSRASLGQRPRDSWHPDNQALKARLNPAWLLNPKGTAHRNQRRACGATRGIPLERRECGVLVGLFYGRNVDLASPFAKGRG
jgi:hypothetical protein